MSDAPEAKEGRRRIWKYFVAIWLLPVWLIVIYIVKPGLQPSPFEQAVFCLYFFSAHLFWGVPYMRRQIPRTKAILLGIVAPFIIWVVLVVIKTMFL